MPYDRKNPIVDLSASSICSGLHHPVKKTGCNYLCYNTIEGDHIVNNKVWYWRSLSCNLTTPLRFNTMYYKTKLKLIKFVMRLYCFTELKKKKHPEKKKMFLQHKKQDNFFKIIICHITTIIIITIKVTTATRATLQWNLANFPHFPHFWQKKSFNYLQTFLI